MKSLSLNVLVSLTLLGAVACDGIGPNLTDFSQLGQSQGGILPGSKGDRLHLTQISSQLRLPRESFEADFAVQAFSAGLDEYFAAWSVQVNGQTVQNLVFESHAEAGEDILIRFSLKDLDIEAFSYHELVFYSPEQIPQIAGLIAHQRMQSQDLLEIDADTTAQWVTAVAYQQAQGRAVQNLSAEAYGDLVALQSVRSLGKKMRDLYKAHRGMADLTQLNEIQHEIQASALEMKKNAEKRLQNNAGGQASQGSSQGGGNSGNSQGGGPPENAGGQSNQGHSQGGGPPENAGEQGDQGHSQGDGPPENAGGQGNQGNSQGGGPPENAGGQGNQGNSQGGGPPENAGGQGNQGNSQGGGPPENAGGQGNQGNSQGGGPPENAGGQGNQGHSQGSGPPENAGEQGNQGHSQGGGPPENAGGQGNQGNSQGGGNSGNSQGNN